MRAEVSRSLRQRHGPRVDTSFLVGAGPAHELLAMPAGVEFFSVLGSKAELGEAQTMNERLNRTLAYPRFRATLLTSFAVLAVCWRGLGLYGVLSQLVGQRRQEFAVRMALGTQRRDVLGLVVRQGLLLTAGGLAAGDGSDAGSGWRASKNDPVGALKHE